MVFLATLRFRLRGCGGRILVVVVCVVVVVVVLVVVVVIVDIIVGCTTACRGSVTAAGMVFLANH